MNLSEKQIGVLKGMIGAMLLSLLIISLGVLLDPFNFEDQYGFEFRINVLSLSIILPILILVVSIGRLARFRFLSPEDIDGSGLTSGSKKAKLLQSLLQNTLEQTVIACGVYVVWCLVMPASGLSVIPIASISFAVGRIFFFNGYDHGASARAFGFALTFYPTVFLMLFFVIYKSIEVLS